MSVATIVNQRDYDQTDLILELKRIFDESDIVEDKRDFSTIAEKLITA